MTTVQKWGNSLGVRIPKDIVRAYGLAPGCAISFRPERHRIVLIPSQRRTSAARKGAWAHFIIPTKKKKENVSGAIDKLLYG